jgi:aspartate aminotransferase-like enzyme
MIHHRTPEFDQILARVLKGLKTVFQTKNSVFIHTSTGSGGMESALVNTLSPGNHVLAIVSGKFGERWAEMAKIFGAKVEILNVPWGEAVDPQKVREHLEKSREKNISITAVLCQACETSTAVAHPIQKIGKIISEFSDTLFLVDGITAVGAYSLPMDEWSIDGLVAGSQKAFMLPTGLSFISFSEKAWRFIEKSKTPKFYFDIQKEKAANAKGETLFSSAVPLIRALDYVLSEVEKNGLQSLYQTIHRRAEMTRLFAPRLGFSLYAQSASDSVTALMVPANMDGQKIRQYLEDQFKITVMGGQDNAKGKIIRIGHMGYIQDTEMRRLFDSLGRTLMHFDPSVLKTSDLEKIMADLALWQGNNS